MCIRHEPIFPPELSKERNKSSLFRLSLLSYRTQLSSYYGVVYSHYYISSYISHMVTFEGKKYKDVYSISTFYGVVLYLYGISG